MENGISNRTEELWTVYVWWSCVLVLKMIALTWVTGRLRVARKVIHSEEDRAWLKGPGIILCPTGGGHQDVDRIRSSHRHDLETVLPYLLITPIWLTTSPLLPLARMILLCFPLISISQTLLHVKFANPPSYCATILSTLEYSILIYISTITTFHYAV